MKWLKSCALMCAVTLSGCVTNQSGVTIPFMSSIPDDGAYIESLSLPAAKPFDAATIAKEKKKVKIASVGFAPIEGLEQYAQGILDNIIAAAPQGAPEAKVYLVANLSPGATAMREGAIFLYYSAFEYLQSEDQLAFLIAHEYSHVMLQHSPENLFSALRPYLLTAVDFAVSYASEDDQLRKSVQLYGSDILMRDLLLPAWDREAEREADHLGVDLMVRAGYNPSEAIRYFTVQDKYDESFQRLHVHTRNRLEKEIEAQFAVSEDNAVWGKIMGDLSDGFGQMMEDISSSHADAKERMLELTVYSKREYRNERRRGVKQDAFQTIVYENRATLDKYKSAHQVSKELVAEKPDLRALEKLARVAVSGETASHPYTRRAFAMLREYQGKYDLALKNYDLVQDDEFLAVPMEVNRATVMDKSGQRGDAIKRLEAAAIYYDWPIEIYRALYPLVVKSGDADRARELKISCSVRYPQQRELCEGAGEQDA